MRQLAFPHCKWQIKPSSSVAIIHSLTWRSFKRSKSRHGEFLSKLFYRSTGGIRTAMSAFSSHDSEPFSVSSAFYQNILDQKSYSNKEYNWRTGRLRVSRIIPWSIAELTYSFLLVIKLESTILTFWHLLQFVQNICYVFIYIGVHYHSTK